MKMILYLCCDSVYQSIFVWSAEYANLTRNIWLALNLVWTKQKCRYNPQMYSILYSISFFYSNFSYSHKNWCRKVFDPLQFHYISLYTFCFFPDLCDFQYVPLVSTEDGLGQVCVYDQLVPQGMEKADWLNHPAPLYLPPAAFTRMDAPQVWYIA